MADPESQNRPLAPPSVPKSNDELYAAGITPFKKRKHEESSKCLVYLLAAVVFAGVIFLIFGSVFLRVVNPKLRLTSVEIQNFQSGATNTSQSLNVTMLTRVTVINGNFGRYDFENCNAVVLYRGVTIGSGDVSGGKVGARTRESMSVTMRIGTENLNVTDSSIFNNNNSSNTEVVEISSYAKMTGRVRVMKIVDRRKTIEMNCTMELNLVRRSVRISLCAS
uniref:late embryogenesis abundant protein At1g64065 n=1 Tax=Erigeron canadensis TaxID=72917 RepID=UPI001CB8CEBE|nr:late embryogenesis abundant protein At1g64065 [Erigeron canadensis]